MSDLTQSMIGRRIHCTLLIGKVLFTGVEHIIDVVGRFTSEVYEITCKVQGFTSEVGQNTVQVTALTNGLCSNTSDRQTTFEKMIARRIEKLSLSTHGRNVCSLECYDTINVH